VSLFAGAVEGEEDAPQLLLEHIQNALRDLLSESSFVVVFFDSETPLMDLAAGGQLSIKWLWKAYLKLHHEFGARCLRINVVHATKRTRHSVGALRGFVSPASWRQLNWVDSLEELYKQEDLSSYPLPQWVQLAEQSSRYTPRKDQAMEAEDNDVERGILSPVVQAAMVQAAKMMPHVHRKMRSLSRLSHPERALLAASSLGELSTVSSILFEHPEALEARDGSGLTPLLLASRGGHTEVASHLLVLGADPSLVGGSLHNAPRLAKSLHPSLSRMLQSQLGAKAESNQAAGHREAVEALLSHGGGGGVKERGEALVSSAEEGEKELVARLLATRTTGMYRTRALAGASSYGHYDVVWLMLQAGVAVNGSLQDGSTALMRSCSLGHHDITKALVQRKAKLDLTDENESTALHHAVSFGATGTVQHLLAAKASMSTSIEAGDSSKMTPLALSALYGLEGIVTALLDAKANPNARDENGATSLMLAHSFGFRDVADRLLDAKADPRIRDAIGKSVIDYVAVPEAWASGQMAHALAM